MKRLIRNIGKFISYFFSPQLVSIVKSAIVYFRSGYYGRFFKAIGKDVVLCSGSSFQGAKYISLGDYVCIGARTVIAAWETNTYNPVLEIAKNVNIGDDCHITASNKIIIGKGSLLGKKVTITDNSHGNSSFSDLSIYPTKRAIVSKGPVLIGERVWIGDKATILPNVVIGDGAIIGANAVVTKNVPANSVVVGPPCIILKKE